MRQDIKENVYEYFSINTPYKTIKRLLGGMSNYTYVIEVLNKNYTVRKVGKNASNFVSRKLEEEHLKEAYKLNLVPQTKFFSIKTGTKISLYIDGIILSETDYKPYIHQIAETLHKIHNHIPEKVNDYKLIERLSLYESYLTNIVPLYQELKLKWIEMYHDKYSNDPKVFTHGDAQRSNIVIKDKKLYLLDWEFAGYNDPYYDLASFGNISFKDSIELLEAYLGMKPTEKELNKLRFYRMFQALQWHLVASYKDIIGLGEELKLDFNLYSKKYLELAQNLYNEINQKALK